MKGIMDVRTKIVINNHVIERANTFNYLRCTVTLANEIKNE
jgi:hypothetical protein